MIKNVKLCFVHDAVAKMKIYTKVSVRSCFVKEARIINLQK